MIWSIIPDFLIFEEAFKPELEELSADGHMVMAQKQEDGSYKIERILSTNPSDFLNPSCLPGRTIYKK